MTFRTYFEAKEADMELIKGAIDKVEDRPFKDLFGDKDRFLVKVYNPELTLSLNKADLKREDFDWNTRTYKGQPLRKAMDAFKQEAENDMMGHDALMDEFININPEIWEYIIEDIKSLQPFMRRRVDGKMLIRSHVEPQKIYGAFHPRVMEGLSEDNWRDDDIEKFVRILIGFKYNPDNKDFEDAALRWSYTWHRFSLFRDKMTEVEDRKIKAAAKVKQCVDQNNVFFYLLFSRHPVDVLRMSDHKGVSSCHRLDGGMYKHCAIADAQNDGGVIYLVKGSDGQRLSQRLEEQEVFEDAHRKVDGIRPLGRTRLRRFIDLKTGQDFATLARLSDQFGTFTNDLWDTANAYIRKNQTIFSNPPMVDYAQNNIVMAGGTYTDGESPAEMMQKFFGKDDYSTNTYKNIGVQGNEEVNYKEQLQNEMNAVIELYEDEMEKYGFTVAWYESNGRIIFNLNYTKYLTYDDIPNLVTFPEELVFDPASNKLHKFLESKENYICDEFTGLFQIQSNITSYVQAGPTHVTTALMFENWFGDADEINQWLSRLVRKFKGIPSIWADLFEEGRGYWTTETK